MNRQNHIIHRLELEIDTPLGQTAYEIKDRIGEFLQVNVFPQLATLLNEMVSEKQLIRFDQLVLDLKTEKWNDSAAILNRIEQEIRRRLDGISNFSENKDPGFKGSGNAINGSDKIYSNGAQLIEKLQNQEDIFFEYLTSGMLPWFANKEQFLNQLKKKKWNKLISKPSFVTRLFSMISNDKKALQRFVNQVSGENILLLLANAEVVRAGKLKELQDNLDNFNATFRRSLLESFLNVWISGLEANMNDFEQLDKEYKKEQHKIETNKNLSFTKWFHNYLIINKVLPENPSGKILGNTENTLHNLMLKRGQTTQNKNGDLEINPTIISRKIAGIEGEREPLEFTSIQVDWMVQNAGQVLFHPFIRLLFLNFGWLDEQGILKDEFRVEAVHALHYCNTGNNNFFEPDLLLEKFLCGMPFHQTVPSECLLSRNTKREITFMVKEVIRNWPELKNTSPNGLREAFIQRSGKLTKHENGYKLIVERKVQDVLLEKLSWNISIIKMPWQEELLFVEW